MPFLTVVTRCYKRPQMLRRNQAALDAQTCDDWEQLLLVDAVGRGVGWANAQFAAHADDVSGDYVLMLDDDDMLARSDAIETLKDAAKGSPELIVFRADHKQNGILPTAEVWGQEPKATHISGQDFITRADVWRAHIAHFAQTSMGDIAFLRALWPNVADVVWLDELLVEVQRVSLGAAE